MPSIIGIRLVKPSCNPAPPAAPLPGHQDDDDGFSNKGIGDAGSTADFRMPWSAIVCLGLGLLLMQAT